ncbi:MAG: hypothetical protein KBD50_00930 [Candidatus Pacebacteria bacterium]|nr:hypothetical protein [Candidatus Paceibacterota bacterium]
MSFAKALTWGVLISFAMPLSAYAAQLSVSATPSTVQVGSTVTVTVHVNSEGVAINNAEGSLTFPRDIFDVVSVSSDISIFSLWIQAPTYNGNNAISFNGGLPSPGYVGASGKVFSVVLRAKAAGSAAFALENSAVRANDGLGTNVLTRSTGGFATVQAPKTVPVTQPATKSAPSAASSVLSVKSQTHSEEDRWYSEKQAVLTWSVPAGTDAVQTILSDSSSDIPAVLYQPPITEKKLDDLEDGVWYFAVRTRGAAGWGSVARYKLQIDTTPPTLQDVRMEYVDQDQALAVRSDEEVYSTTHLAISSVASDNLSGVAQVDIVVDGTVRRQVAYTELSDTTYQLPLQLDPGYHVAHVKVYDNAGNSIDSRPVQFQVVAHDHVPETSFFNMFTNERVVMLVLLCAFLLSLISILMNFVLWHKLHHTKGRPAAGKSWVKQDARQKLQALVEDIGRHRREFENEHKPKSISPEDAEYIQKMWTHLAEAEDFLTEKMRQVSKE